MNTLPFRFISRTAVLAVVLLLLVGCSKQPTEPPQASFSHVVTTDTEYYATGPQQGRPPDGTFQAGTQVTLIEEAGSYVLVRSEKGVEAYVAADSLKSITGASTLSNPEIQQVVTGNNRFAMDLYGQLADSRSGNLFFSPNSLLQALAMTYAGAKGETAREMAEALHFPLPQERLHPAFERLNSVLQGGQKRGYQLRMANRLWGQEGETFLPEFLRITRDHYFAELGQVDFVQEPEAARQTINAWIEDRTNGKIENLLPRRTLDPTPRLVLTNAIYFKGRWTEPFKERLTREAPFHVSATETVDVPMMHQEEEFRYAELQTLQVLELPYGEDKALSMLILLPKEVDGLSELEEDLTNQRLDRWMSNLRKREVRVFLPKFRMTSQFSLNDALQSLGMELAFAPDEADFSGMNGGRDLFLSAALHKAFVDVNEEGTEASAATGLAAGGEAVQQVPVFRADHPFVFLIRDNDTGSILFLGRLVHPKEGM